MPTKEVRHTPSLMRYFARNSFVRLLTFGAGILVTFVVTPHVLHSMGKAGYGTWTLIVGLYGYYMLLECGIYQAVSQKTAAYLAKSREHESTGIYSSALCFLSVVSILSIASGWLLNAFSDTLFPSEYSASLGICILLTTASFGCMLFARAAFGLLAGAMHWTLLALFASARLFVSATGVLIFLQPSLPHETNLVRMAYISAASFLVEQVCIVVAANRLLNIKFSWQAASLAEVKSLLRFGLPLQVVSIGNLLKRHTLIYIVGSVLGVAHTALFSLANQVSRYMNDLLLSTFGILSPYFSQLNAQGDQEACRASLISSIRLSYTIACTLGLGLVFYGAAFFTWWLGPSYVEIQEVVIPLACADILICGEIPVFNCLVGLERHKILAYYSVRQGIFITTLAFPAAYFFGLAGVGWVVFAATAIVSLGLLPAAVSRAVNLPAWHYYRHLALILLPQIAVQLLFFLCIRRFVEPTLFSLLAVGLGQSVVAGIVFCLMHLPLGKLIRRR